MVSYTVLACSGTDFLRYFRHVPEFAKKDVSTKGPDMLNRRVLITLGASLMLCACTGTGGYAEAEGVTVYLVRHAEKEAGPDPMLTAEGTARAKRLAGLLQDETVTEVWSTDTRRTLATAAPVAEDHGLEVQLYEPEHMYRMAERMRDKSGVVVIVGHSNTTPVLAEAMTDRPEPAEFDESDYESLYRVDINADGEAVAYRMSYDALEMSLD